jgi:predicted amidohydrolase
LEFNIKQYKNLFAKFSRFIEKSNVICFPEYWNGVRKDNYTETVSEKSLEFLRETSSRYSAWLIGGSHLTSEKGKFKNKSHIFSPSGKLIGSYNKRNLFGYERYKGIIAGEKDFIFNLNEWNATIRICSDLWNTQDHSMLLRKKIDIIFSPTLTSLPDQSYTNYGRFLWHNLAVIRSKEAGVVVVVSDPAMQVIKEPYWSAGASCIADPSWRFKNQEPIGANILSSLPDGREGIVSVNVNLGKIKEQKDYRINMGLMSKEC